MRPDGRISVSVATDHQPLLERQELELVVNTAPLNQGVAPRRPSTRTDADSRRESASSPT